MKLVILFLSRYELADMRGNVCCKQVNAYTLGYIMKQFDRFTDYEPFKLLTSGLMRSRHDRIDLSEALEILNRMSNISINYPTI